MSSFILASASPRRLALLEKVGIHPAEVIPANIDETPLTGEKPEVYVLRMAEEKAAAVAANHNGKVVLAADTTVACGRRILGQPEHAEEARQFLTLLSGRRHRVYTAVALVGADGQCRSQRVMTQVAFRRLSDGDIQAYLDSGEWEGKAGGYGIQGYAARFVRRINGSYTSVVGLPLDEAWQMLKSAGAI